MIYGLKASCLAILFDIPTSDDSFEASKRYHTYFLLRLIKHKNIWLILNRPANPFDKRKVVILNNQPLIKKAKLIG